jgi:2-C-methyl-D-erythritol 4-phosphate cytidylyltransferase
LAVALIVAAGLGERLGLRRPKAFVELAGQPLLYWSLSTLREAAGIDRIVVAMPGQYATASGTDECSIAFPPSWNVLPVQGGATRSESVRLALEAVGPGGPVLVHDAARPLLSLELVAATLTAAGREGVDAAIAATPVTDTIKRAGEGGVVSDTLDRSTLWAVQTPQVFRRDALERALDVAPEILAQATDDAWLVERAGGRVVVVPAPPENLKVTTPLDLALAELLIARRDDPDHARRDDPDPA